MRFLLFALIILASLVSISCGKNTTASQSWASIDDEQNDFDSDDDTPPTSTLFKPDICSDLNFENVAWPAGTDQTTATVFGLAMNMSGSFEGHDGWDNLSNNFDGQGVSLGLFNQNLGQGSLQTLLLQFHKTAEHRLKSILTTQQFTSLTAMLKTWNGGSILSKAKNNSLDVYDNATSPLDDPALLEEAEEFSLLGKTLTKKNQAAVNWAVNTVYSGSKFKPEWKMAFQKLANSDEYISIQVQAAKNIHNRATAYMKKYNFKELRSYLFFFDVVVQNGSITAGIETKFAAWLKTNSSLSESAKLKKLLELRLTLVKAVYVKDVRSRKTAIIDGIGIVHGSKRDFRKEYCAPAWGTLFTKRPTLK